MRHALGLAGRLGLVVALVCLGVWEKASAQGNSGGDAGDAGVLRGTVVNGVTREPVGRAEVYSSDNRFAVMTDERGRFEMVFKRKRVEAGPVALGGVSIGGGPGGLASGSGGGEGSGGIAGDVPGGIVGGAIGTTAVVAGAGGAQSQPMEWDRPDYLTPRKNGFLFEMEGVPGVGVGRDQSEVTLTLVPEARVIGRVTLPGGEGAWGIQVSLYKRQVDGGRVRWVSAGRVLAKSDGEFRFAELGAGSYKLLSEELLDTDPLTSDPRGQLYGYPPLYYPAAADFGSGAVIRLKAGETFPVSLTPEKKKYYPVRIGFAGSSAGVVPQVEVSREGHDGPGFSLGYDFRDGSIGGTLPDGNYSVKITSQGGAALTGMTNIAVNGGPSVGWTVAMVPGSTVHVRVNEEFSRTQEGGQVTGTDGIRNGAVPRPQYVQVSLVPVVEFDNQQQYAAQQQADLDGDELVIENVPPGKYRVVAQAAQVGYVSSMRCGDTDVQHSILEIGAGATVPPIEVTIRDDGADVSGTVVEVAKRNQGRALPTAWQPEPPAVVYFVPVHEGGAEVREAWVEFNGIFRLPQLAPGSYRVLPFDHPKPNLEFANEEAMAQYDAQVITVAPGQKEQLRVSFLEEQ